MRWTRPGRNFGSGFGSASLAGVTGSHSQPTPDPPTITQEVTWMTSTDAGVQQTKTRSEIKPSGSVWRAGLAAAGIAMAANLAVFAIARAAGTSFRVHFAAHQAATSVAAGHVLGASLSALAIGTAVTALWLRRLNHGLAAAQGIGAVIALLSLAIPLGVHADPGTKAALAVMHLVAGTAFVMAIGRARAVPRARLAKSQTEQQGRAADDEAA